MKFKDIPQYTKSGNYNINVDWRYLKKTIEGYTKEEKDMAGLDLYPDFQRGRV